MPGSLPGKPPRPAGSVDLMTDQTPEADELHPDEERQERWAELAPDATTAEQVPEEPTAPGSLGGDNGGA